MLCVVVVCSLFGVLGGIGKVSNRGWWEKREAKSLIRYVVAPHGQRTDIVHSTKIIDPTATSNKETMILVLHKDVRDLCFKFKDKRGIFRSAPEVVSTIPYHGHGRDAHRHLDKVKAFFMLVCLALAAVFLREEGAILRVETMLQMFVLLQGGGGGVCWFGGFAVLVA